jgi:crotonobetaine/carnitine-CoA ligase
MLEILMRQPEREDDAENPLRLCYTGPAPPRERHLEIERRFGLEIVCGYALSETPYGLIWKRGTRPYGTLGSVRQHPTIGVINEARVMDAGREVGVGVVGELELKNPAIMRGYFGMPEETEKVLSDGWLRTGDLVQVDESDVYTFVGRKKELIRRRGENLSPLEVEAALEAHPAVAEAAVIGVPSELSEEEIKAFVVLREGKAVSMTELREFVSERLAPFKVPRFFEAMSELPHTPTGRIAKHELSRDRSETQEDLDPRPATSENVR